ncbi:glycerophosphodiester phosphodiesterase [Zobellia uliginosa]|uniref:glycerophosphodiester phosphodiesterase n=1 Tax=Zobellia uliginosa TaxID=143224 RepID=UPI0026E2EA5D|nr:glycerophosphodiester phosphodiesterase family protein [Zobellia uliginosa]MDO6519869.1 glycerophosphodiester phosphodiesterase family protein [Zobellia uliginosa]
MRCIVLLMTMILVGSCSTTKKAVDFSQNKVVAHRGAWKAKNLPENSIASLKEAIRMQCAGSEFDVRMTANDSLIITHDPDYAKLEIEESSYEDLSKFPLKNGEVLPTLRQYILAGLENNTTTRLVCEIKPSKNKERGLIIAEKAYNLINELNAQHMVVYISFSYDILKRLEELNPEVHTQYLDGSKSPEVLKRDGIDGADYYLSVFKKHPEWITSAKKNKIALNAWTVNEEEDMEWFLKNDFDYITTNEPELLLKKTAQP